LEEETKIIGEKAPQCHFVHKKIRMNWDRTREAAVKKPATNRLGYGTT
jgi:hypothetical protein